jgi:hypothetical protein
MDKYDATSSTASAKRKDGPQPCLLALDAWPAHEVFIAYPVYYSEAPTF